MIKSTDVSVRRHALLVLGVVLVHVLLSGYALSAEPVWVDEGATWLYAQRSFAQLWTVDLWSETNPPTYYSMMRVWIAAFGDSLTAMRSLSLVASAISLVFVYLIMARLTRSVWTSSLAAIGVATSPIVVYYSQEARSYTFAMLASMIALWGLTVLLTHPAAASRPLARMPAGRSVPPMIRLAWCAYGLGAAAALYFHFTLAFLQIGCTAAAVLCWLFNNRFRPRWIVNWVVINILAMLLAAPVLIAFVYHSLHSLESFWITKPTVTEGLAISAKAYISHFPQKMGGDIVYLVTALILIGSILIPSLRRQRRVQVGWALGTCLAVGVPVIVWLISQYKPIMIDRTMFWSVPALAVGLAVVGHAVLPRYVLRGGLVFIILIGVAHSVYQNHNDHKQDYQPLLELAAELGTDQTAYYSSSHSAFRAIAYLQRHQKVKIPDWTYLTDEPTNLSISQSVIMFDEAVDQLRQEDDIIFLLRESYGYERYLRPALEDTHTFSVLAVTSDKWARGTLYRIQRIQPINPE